MRFAKCSDALYYDLVKIPHGHVPAPMVRFWRWLPMPLNGYRTEWTFSCPVCGEPSFFKIWDMCWDCEQYGDWSYDDDRYKRRREREKWRRRWKTLEYVFLPLLVLLGKSWYLRSTRIAVLDYPPHGGNLTQQLQEEISKERIAFIEKYEYGGYP